MPLFAQSQKLSHWNPVKQKQERGKGYNRVQQAMFSSVFFCMLLCLLSSVRREQSFLKNHIIIELHGLERTSQIIQFQTLATARLPSSRWGTGSGCPGLIQAGLENHLDFRKVETNKIETVFHADFNSNWKSFLKFCQTCCWVTDIWVHLWPSPSQWDSFSAWEGYWMMTKLTFSCP